MKKLTILFFAITLIGCGCNDTSKQKYPEYKYGIDVAIPDSVREAHRQYVIQCISAVNYHLSAGDYEHPESSVWRCRDVAKELYGMQMEGLYIIAKQYSMQEFYPYYQLHPSQKIIFNSLKPVIINPSQ